MAAGSVSVHAASGQVNQGPSYLSVRLLWLQEEGHCVGCEQYSLFY